MNCESEQSTGDWVQDQRRKKLPVSQPNHLELWDKVRTPDPKYTKEFNRGGGFKGTATNTQYLVRLATETFGQNGIGWGLEITDEKYVQGHHISDLDTTIIHVVRGRVWYMSDGEKRYTSEQFGQTTFVGANKHGCFTDEEAPKKSVTDMMLKCLSLLGFSADIFMGLWDDNKYVSDVRKQFEKKDPPKDVMPPDEAVALVNSLVKMSDGCETVKGLTGLYNDNKAKIELLPDGQKADLLAYFGERKSALKEAA